MKQITVDFSKYGDIDEKHRPMTHIANALYKKNLDGNPIYLDEKTNIIYAPICTRDHFERFYGNVTQLEQGPILDKIRAEIKREIIPSNSDQYDYEAKWQNSGLRMALKVIDKHKAESEESDD